MPLALALWLMKLLSEVGTSQPKSNQTHPFRTAVFSEKCIRRAISEVSAESQRMTIEEGDTRSEATRVEQSRCECCGFLEECTASYIQQVSDSHSGKWVCGICSEAVKERIKRVPRTAMEEALSSHKDLCERFNTTTRQNPKLSLTMTMRELARRSAHQRNDHSSMKPRIGRTSSCAPRIE
ncbi:uncharacterized protein LOC117922418 [Vitis riparia]|uniref:uncharacterized protein LOC117922418 n=1 Tax=Vitis riparia TaxID=96939 RepID=UPI00155A2194|nr:uncharacterized protein LOC117922418 [Vitis riparia]